MNSKIQTRFFGILISIGVLTVLSSCVNTRKATYFNDQKDSDFASTYESLEPILQKNDLLSISVTSLNPEASEIFNLLNVNPYQNNTPNNLISQATGYLIDQDGAIRFPILGNIIAAGKTKEKLRDEITEELKERKLLLDPIVDVRYLNYRISVLGEVGRPSVLLIPNEKVTLLEALSLAGDLTIFARRDNVLLIREENGVKQLRRINLTTSDIFTSPYYNLKSNDIIYVEPNKSKVASTNRITQWLPIIISTLSLAVIAFDRLY